MTPNSPEYEGYRRYQPVWEALKLSPRQKVRVQLTLSDDAQKVKAMFKTFRRAIQKEKWLDNKFKHQYPTAVLHTVLTDGNVVELTLVLPVNLEDL